MSLADHLESRFRGDVRFRGAEYLKTEQIVVVQVTPDSFLSVISDGEEFETGLHRQDDDLVMRCSCSKQPEGEAACKHLWASILVVDQQGFLAGQPANDYLPPFTASETTAPDSLLGETLLEDLADEDEEFAEFLTRSGGRRSWEVRLEDLAGRLQRDSSQPPTERQIAFEIDVARSKTEGHLVLQTSQRERRANGEWGKWKALRVHPAKLDTIEDSQDRALLAVLSGAVADQKTGSSRSSGTAPSSFCFHLPSTLAEQLVPRLCDTGRLFLAGDEPSEADPLTWDAGPAWEFRLEIEHDSTAATWNLNGHFQRAEEEHSLADVTLVIPGGIFFANGMAHRHGGNALVHWAALLTDHRSFQVPDGEEEDLVARLLDVPDLPSLQLPEPLQLEEIECQPVPHLQLTIPRGRRWQRQRLLAALHFDYAGTTLPAHSSKSAVIIKDRRCCTRRHNGREDLAWAELADAGFEKLDEHRRGLRQVEISIDRLSNAVQFLIDAGWQVVADDLPVRQPAEMQMSVRSKIDWFELHADVDFSGQRVGFPDLLSAISRGETAIRLDDGSLGLLPEEWSDRYSLINQLGVIEDQHVRFAPSQVALLDALLASRESINVDESFAEMRQQLASFDGINEAAQPDQFEGELRGYQKEGLGWLQFLHQFRFGGCLADDMGLGKTVQVLAMLADCALEKTHRPSLIIVPRSLMFNWFEEASRFCPQLAVLEYSGQARAALREDFDRYDIILTTYGTLRRDILDLKDIEFQYVVLDEAQTIKNAGSQVAKASRLLKAEHRLALSGTPIENHLGDLWSIFEFLNPGMLGRSSLFRNFTDDENDNRGLLTRGLQPFILRRTKAQVAADLPERFEQTILCRLGTEQQRMYNEMRDHYRQSLIGIIQEQGLSKTRMHVLEALLRLRQAACHPGLLDSSLTGGDSAKLDVLCPHLEQLVVEGHKALVFSQFTSMLAIVREHLDRRNIVYEYLDGQTRDRKARIDRFQSDEDCGVFLISLKAGGLGLNLTAADYVFLLDPWWNPAVEMQAIDRAHRVGQTRPVFAYRLICRDTVEEKIAELQQQKRELADAILLQHHSVLKNLTRDDLELLLS